MCENNICTGGAPADHILGGWKQEYILSRELPRRIRIGDKVEDGVSVKRKRLKKGVEGAGLLERFVIIHRVLMFIIERWLGHLSYTYFVKIKYPSD
jgi:hypothetical protein